MGKALPSQYMCCIPYMTKVISELCDMWHGNNYVFSKYFFKLTIRYWFLKTSPCKNFLLYGSISNRALAL